MVKFSGWNKIKTYFLYRSIFINSCQKSGTQATLIGKDSSDDIDWLWDDVLT
jgi:hypothetical protein